MDSFYEHLIAMRHTKKDIAFKVLIWLAAFLLVFILVNIALSIPALMGFVVIIAVGVFYGATLLSKRLDIEYEAIVVNRDMDIDKIIAKSSRKRMVSIKLTEVEEYGNFNESTKNNLSNRKFDFSLVCCNSGEEARYLVYRHPKKGVCFIVIEYNEKLENEILKSVSRTVVKK